jgi:hypothetical protein
MLRAEARALDEVRAEEAPEQTPAERLAPVRAAPADSPFGPRPARPITATQAGDEPVPSPERARWNAMYAELAAREHPRGTPTEETDPS